MGVDDEADDIAQRARLKDLSSALDKHHKASTSRQDSSVPTPSGLGQAVNLGFRVMSEFVAAVVVSAAIGWTIDHWLGSSPVALIVFIALGTAAGFWSVYRIAAKPSGPSIGR